MAPPMTVRLVELTEWRPFLVDRSSVNRYDEQLFAGRLSTSVEHEGDGSLRNNVDRKLALLVFTAGGDNRLNLYAGNRLSGTRPSPTSASAPRIDAQTRRNPITFPPHWKQPDFSRTFGLPWPPSLSMLSKALEPQELRVGYECGKGSLA